MQSEPFNDKNVYRGGTGMCRGRRMRTEVKWCVYKSVTWGKVCVCVCVQKMIST